MTNNDTAAKKQTGRGRTFCGDVFRGLTVVLLLGLGLKFFHSREADKPVQAPAANGPVVTAPVVVPAGEQRDSPRGQANLPMSSQPRTERPARAPILNSYDFKPEAEIGDAATPGSGSPYSAPRRADTEQQQQFQQALLWEAMLQQQRARQALEHEGFMRAVEQSRVCHTCGGAGSYRYVGAAGVLQVRQCPKCQGLGRNW